MSGEECGWRLDIVDCLSGCLDFRPDAQTVFLEIETVCKI